MEQAGDQLNALAQGRSRWRPWQYGSLAELETATATYQAVVKCPSDQTLVTAYAG